MNRDRFMKELEMLLSDISAEERAEALQYYSDYFADAGAENEGKVMEELGDPGKVAETIKAGLGSNNEEHQEYRETGYTDTRFEEKEMPGSRKTAGADTGYHPEYVQKKEHPIGKILLILAIIFIGLPIALPLGIGMLLLLFGILASIAAALVSVVILSAAAAFCGGCFVVVGAVKLIPNVPVGLLLMGIGLIIGAVGVVATVLLGKFSWICLRTLFRGVVALCRRPFHRKAV